MDLILILAWITLGILGIAFSQWPLLVAFTILGIAGLGLTLKEDPLPDNGTAYTAIRLSKGNLPFPTRIIVEPTRVIRHQTHLIGYEEESITLQQIASVRITTGLLWSDVIIESTGGQNQIVCHGHTNHDAIAIKTEIERRLSAWAKAEHHLSEQPTFLQPSHLPSTTGVLLVSLYAAPPSSANALYRWPTPITRLQIGPGEDLTACLLQLLQQGGVGCHVRVTQYVTGTTETSP